MKSNEEILNNIKKLLIELAQSELVDLKDKETFLKISIDLEEQSQNKSSN